MTSYLHSYLDTISDVLETKWNLSTGYKAAFNIIFFVSGPAWFMPLMYYVYYKIIGKSDIVLMCWIWLSWFWWDIFPICMTNNGIKIANVVALLFDCTFASFVWVWLSLFFYKRYKNSINNPTLLLLVIANIAAMMIFFYETFIYNRKGTEHNWLVKLGDRFGIDKILPYFRITNPIKL